MIARAVSLTTLIFFITLAAVFFSFAVAANEGPSAEIVIRLDRTPGHFPIGSVVDWRDTHNKTISGNFLSIWNTRLQRGSDSLHLFFEGLPEKKLSTKSIGKPLPDSGSILGRIDGRLVSLSIVNTNSDYYLYDDMRDIWEKYSPDQFKAMIVRHFPRLRSQEISDCGHVQSISENTVVFYLCLYTSELGLQKKKDAATQQPLYPMLTDGVGIIYYETERKSPYQSGLEYCVTGKCNSFVFKNPGAFPYMITRMHEQFLVASNYGGVRRYDYQDGSIESIRDSDTKSYQLYTSINDGSRIVIGQYPYGRLLTLSEDQKLIDMVHQLPLMEEDLAAGAEVQSMAAYDGRLFAGVWPWGEVYTGSYEAQWSLFHRFFSGPTKDAFAQLLATNNLIGQRIYDMITVGNSLYVATSSKAADILDPALLQDHLDLYPEYGRIYKIDGGRSVDIPMLPLYERGYQTIRIKISERNITISAEGNRTWTLSNGAYKPCSVRPGALRKVIAGVSATIETIARGCNH